MKDKLPNNWEWVKLKEIFDVRDGTHNSPKYVQEEGHPLVTSKNLKNNGIDLSNVKYISTKDFEEINKRSKVDVGDLIFAMIGTIGNPTIVKDTPNFAIKNVALFKENSAKCSNYFLKYYLLSNISNSKMIDEANGSTQKFVGLNYLRNFSIPLPPVNEQKKIINILESIFSKVDQVIDLTEQNLKRLKKLNESVLDEVFKKLNSKSTICFEDIAVFIQSGFACNKKNEIPEGYIHLRTHNIDLNGNINLNELVKISENFVEKNKSNIKVGDILFNNTNSVDLVGKSCVVKKDESFAYSNHITRIELKSNFNPFFINYYLMNLQKCGYFALICNKWIGQAGINNKMLKEIRFPQIPVSKQENIVEYLDKILDKNNKLIKHYKNKLETLKKLKDSVLDCAFKGELKRAKVISISQSTTDPFFVKKKDWNAKRNADKQAMIIALAMEAHEKTGKSLYRTKGEKTVEVIEKHIDLDFGREAKKMAAGPAAFEHLVRVVEPLAKEKKWFSVQEVKGENYDSHKYIKEENFNAFMMRCVLDLRPNLQEIRRVVELFANMKTTHEAEVVATTYSGWNNLIIRKIQINDEAIVTEARENWHDSKLKIERQEFFNAIEWLKNNNLIPQGNGREVI